MLFLLSILSGTILLTFLIYKLSWRNQFLIDQPNHRSSHQQPTSKSGGLALMLTYFTYTTFQLTTNTFNANTYLLLQTPLAFALIGLIDDLQSSSIQSRLISQTLLAALFLFFLLPTFNHPLTLPIFILSLLTFIWLINAYNFMDGIDGLLALHGISTLFNLNALSLLQTTPHNPLSQNLLLPALAMLLGFLPFNLSKAKTFLGNSGSYFIGSMLIIFLIFFQTTNLIKLPTLLIITSLFLVETTAVLVTRTLKGHKPSVAHRAHLYQISTQYITQQLRKKNIHNQKARKQAHNTVSTAYAIINLALLPIAFYSQTNNLSTAWLVCLALITLELILFSSALHYLNKNLKTNQKNN